MQPANITFAATLITLVVSASAIPQSATQNTSSELASAQELAEQLVTTLERAERLEISSVQSAHIYKATGMFRSLEEAGDAAWFVTSHEGFGRNVMTPHSFHLELWRGDRPVGKPLMILKMNEGLMTERQWRPKLGDYETTVYETSEPGGVGDIELQSYFYQQSIPLNVKVCNFAYLFATWVGNETATPQRLAGDVRKAEVTGIIDEDGREYYLLKQKYAREHGDDGYSGRIDIHWIDLKTGLIARWHTFRVACHSSGESTDFMNECRRSEYTLSSGGEQTASSEKATP